jgi:hypothetical protein
MRELDSLAGFERQEQEEVIKIVTGSMYHGEVLHPWTKYIALTSSTSAGSETVRVS